MEKKIKEIYFEDVRQVYVVELVFDRGSSQASHSLLFKKQIDAINKKQELESKIELLNENDSFTFN